MNKTVPAATPTIVMTAATHGSADDFFGGGRWLIGITFAAGATRFGAGGGGAGGETCGIGGGTAPGPPFRDLDANDKLARAMSELSFTASSVARLCFASSTKLRGAD